MKRFIISVVMVLASALAPLAFANGFLDRDIGRLFDYPPAPRLIYPISDKVNLSGKESLEFKWDVYGGYINTAYFDFRLYKGYNTVAANLILKKRVDYNAYSIKVSSDLFEDNQVYTWTLRQILNSGEKSDPSYNSFLIIKK